MLWPEADAAVTPEAFEGKSLIEAIHTAVVSLPEFAESHQDGQTFLSEPLWPAVWLNAVQPRPVAVFQALLQLLSEGRLSATGVSRGSGVLTAIPRAIWHRPATMVDPINGEIWRAWPGLSSAEAWQKGELEWTGVMLQMALDPSRTRRISRDGWHLRIRYSEQPPPSPYDYIQALCRLAIRAAEEGHAPSKKDLCKRLSDELCGIDPEEFPQPDSVDAFMRKNMAKLKFYAL